MNNSFSVPYPIGTYLVRNDGTLHIDEIYKYVVDKTGISAILMLDVKANPHLSREISIPELLSYWKEDTSIHLSDDIDTRLNLGIFDDKPVSL